MDSIRLTLKDKEGQDLATFDTELCFTIGQLKQYVRSELNMQAFELVFEDEINEVCVLQTDSNGSFNFEDKSTLKDLGATNDNCLTFHVLPK